MVILSFKKNQSFHPSQVSLKVKAFGTSLVIHWLRLHTPNTKGEGLISGWRTEIPHATQHSKKKKKKKKKKTTFKVKAFITGFASSNEGLGDLVT